MVNKSEKEEATVEVEVKEKSKKKTSKKVAEKKDSEKKVTKSKTKVEKEEVKKTLLQLVEESDVRYSLIIGALSFANLSKKYNQEKNDYKNGFYVKPSLTDSEFKKILNNFMNRRI